MKRSLPQSKSFRKSSRRRVLGRSLSRPFAHETLEDRNLLAGDLLISELYFNPFFNNGGDHDVDSFIELRGDADTTIPTGTYLVVVDSGADAPGVINSVFDVSDLTLGSKGFLVVAQSGSNYDVDPGATLLQGDVSTQGFGGLNERYQSEAISDRFEHVLGSNTFMLIETETLPLPEEDVDANDDGVLDGTAANWMIKDSITINGVHLGGDSNDKVYGDILFRVDGNQSSAPNGVEAIDVRQTGYVARVGSRTGYAREDWVAGQVDEVSAGSFDLFLDEVDQGVDSYRVYTGSSLNVGSENFFSTVSGLKFTDLNGDGEQGPSEPGTSGVTSYLDYNNNRTLDSYETVVDPDNFAAGTELTRVAPGVTLTLEDSDGGVSSSRLTATLDADDATTGTHVFDASNKYLRMDFTEPVESISIDASNLASGFDRFAALTAYNASGSLIGTYFTQALNNSSETMTIERPSADIAYARAYSDPAFNASSKLDNLRFTKPEPSATTDSNGEYEIENIDAHVGGTKTVALRTIGAPSTDVDLVIDKPQSFFDVDNGLRPVDIIGRTDASEWWLAESDGSSFSTSYFGQWFDGADWEDTLSGDINGDGNADVMGRVGREWWVSKSLGDGFAGNEFWGLWPDSSNWENVAVADVNGDGLSDVIGRNSGGEWWVARSTGSSFVMEQWGSWSNGVTWEDVSVGDFDGDGQDDIAGRANGQWWVASSTGGSFATNYWGAWSNSVTWEDVSVGDFDGDGKDDIAGRANGQWWIGTSTGSAFATNYWGNWSSSVTWEDVSVGDFDGDGQDDIAGRANGQWWIARSNNAFFTVEYWASWSNSVTWEDVSVGDFNGDGKDDIAGRADGNWWIATSQDTYFGVEYWGSWSTSVTWESVHVGPFGASSAQGSSVKASSVQTVGNSDSARGSGVLSSVVVDDTFLDATDAIFAGDFRIRRDGRFQ